MIQHTIFLNLILHVFDLLIVPNAHAFFSIVVAERKGESRWHQLKLCVDILK